MPLEPFLIRDATMLDIPPVTAIYRLEVERGIASMEEIAPTEDEMAARLNALQGVGLPCLVAERGNTILGYAYAGPFHERSAYRYTLEDTIYIEQSARKQGIGRALLKSLLERVEAAGCRQMIAVISLVENSASVALHEKFGFRPMGVARAVGWKFGLWHDVIYMQRAIGAADSTAPDSLMPGHKPMSGHNNV